MDSGKKPAPKNEEPKAELKPEDEEKPKISQEKDTKPPEEPKEEKPVKAAELRTAYENLKTKVAKEYEPKLKRLPELEAKLKELESRDESAGKATQERIASVEKRNAELESHIRFVDYEKSKEYSEQFQKPYEEAWGTALRELKGLTMKVADPNTGEEATREVTQADIAYFANLDPAVRRTEINRLFPEDKEEVKRHINQISHLAQKADEAKKKARENAETHAKTAAEQHQQSQQARTKFWQESNAKFAEKYPQWFAKAEADEEGNTLFDRGTALADLAFDPQSLTPERVEFLPKAFKEQIASGKPFSPQQLVQLHAIIRNKAANHDRLIHQNKALTAQVAELEKSLKQYEKSSPDNVPAGARKQVNGAPSFGEELDALDRKFA